MRDKYLEEAIPPLFIFGVHPNGNVDVSNGNTDVLTDIPKDVAEKVVAANEIYMERLRQLLC